MSQFREIEGILQNSQAHNEMLGIMLRGVWLTEWFMNEWNLSNELESGRNLNGILWGLTNGFVDKNEM